MSVCAPIDLILEFFKVAVHQIIYQRKVYQSRCFRKDLHYAVHTRWCTAPSVEKYIENMIQGIKLLIEKEENQIKQFIVLITTKRPECMPLERFVFNLKISKKIPIPALDADEFCRQCARTLTKLRIIADCKGVNMPAPNRGDGTDVEFRMMVLGDGDPDPALQKGNSSWVVSNDRNIMLDNPVIIPNSRIAVPIHRIRDQNSGKDDSEDIEGYLCIFSHAELIF
jgi:hypothetical protein